MLSFTRTAVASTSATSCVSRILLSSSRKYSTAESNADLASNNVSSDFSPEKIQLPQIERLNFFRNENSGVPGLFSANTLNDIWFNYSNVTLDNIKYFINESARQDFVESFTNPNVSSADSYSNNIVINQYEDLMQKIALNYSKNDIPLLDSVSSIHNLYYFLSSIKPSSKNEISKTAESSLLENEKPFESIDLSQHSTFNHLINKNFNSIDEFLTLLYDSANSIKGNGYTWLLYNCVKTKSSYNNTRSNTYDNLKYLSIINTYNNGTISKHSEIVLNGRKFDEKNGSISSTESALDIPSIEEAQCSNSNLTNFQIPLLSIGSNPSFYLRDYGIYGKKNYLRNVIRSIDWDIVASRIPNK